MTASTWRRGDLPAIAALPDPRLTRARRLHAVVHSCALFLLLTCCSGCFPVLVLPVAALGQLTLALATALGFATIFDLPGTLRAHLWFGLMLIATVLAPFAHRMLLRAWGFAGSALAYRHALIDGAIGGTIIGGGLVAGRYFQGIPVDVKLSCIVGVFAFVVLFAITVGHYYLEETRRELVKQFNRTQPEHVQIPAEAFEDGADYYIVRSAKTTITVYVGVPDDVRAEPLRQHPPSDEVVRMLNRLPSSIAPYVILLLAPPAMALGELLGWSPQMIASLPVIEFDLLAVLVAVVIYLMLSLGAQAIKLATPFRVVATSEVSDQSWTAIASNYSQLRHLLLHNALHDLLVAAALSLGLACLGAGGSLSPGVALTIVAIELLVVGTLILVPFAFGQNGTVDALASSRRAPAHNVKFKPTLTRQVRAYPRSWALKMLAPTVSAQGLLPIVAQWLVRSGLGSTP